MPRRAPSLYARPVAAGVAWWTPLLYASAAVAIGLAIPAVDEALGRPSMTPPSRALILGGLMGLAAVWVASGVLPLSNAGVSLVIGPASAFLVLACDRSRWGALHALLTAAGGVAVEVVLVRAGVFHYSHPDVAGVACWLPWIYVSGSVAVGNLGRRLRAAEAP